jgi:hypothetical protein
MYTIPCYRPQSLQACFYTESEVLLEMFLLVWVVGTLHDDLYCIMYVANATYTPVNFGVEILKSTGMSRCFVG